MLSNALSLLLSANIASAAIHFVCPTGIDEAAGTLEAPYKSIQLAIDRAAPGDTIYLREGTYSPTTNIQVKAKSGNASAPITLSSYNGEKVVIDGEALPHTPGELGSQIPDTRRGTLHVERSEYWVFYGLELIHGPYGVYHINSSNILYERLITHDNYESGVQIQGLSSNNTVLYLDSYRNHDPRKNGESADGFACKEGSGEGNLLKGARLWDNVDDGLDLWEFRSAVTIEDTIAWGNGVNRWNFTPFNGDGNGFKLGGGDEAERAPANHIVRNSIAFANAARGFIDNKQPGAFLMTRNTAFNNGEQGFRFLSTNSTLSDNIAALNQNGMSQIEFSPGQVSIGNSWDMPAAEWSTNASFKSVDSSLVMGPRAADGKIVASDFLLPVSGAEIGATTYW
ncbi:uncharacterized protein L3040_008139 [Drepanopeziza brunnea f. sp. 'multigermtubi']|uniref:Pectate lyase n=1 Tax=Marssonina brunnea f. sp. multigermtubi (strain MB_m1) TaxID=1072389 RepID=K1Y186_MARBU|nr:pectate lyase [Drepanopeziza brunnea f. sp. 'multigermtubi' MB_m1]EKD18919.1 pectate lyase [Drepanopeziza brunnea f. sp. 'multigermtubi' MB_m1]KAJ5034871.1 hypothetical protein L3040_008139 [Drepanopeziza brunnea f. sp. 'multigermtubi']